METKAKGHQATCQDSGLRERSPNTTINRLPGEVLLEIFDFYRQSIKPYDYRWRKKHVWFNLAHVSRKWRAVMFASSLRLDIGITVGGSKKFEKPDHIKAILSGSLPIFLDYKFVEDFTCIRAALKHHERVREIAFAGSRASSDKLFEATTSRCSFPVLEALFLRFGYGPKILDTRLLDAFLGPDLSDPPLRRLRLEYISLASMRRLLLSATALTDLFLRMDTVFGPSPETSLLACLQGMHCLRSLDLSIPRSHLDPLSEPSTPKGIVPLSKLTYFRYIGPSIHLNALAGISAQSLRDFSIQFLDVAWPPTVHLPQFINEHYHAAHVALQDWAFHFSLLTQSEYISYSKPLFNLGSTRCSKESVMRMSGALSARLTTVRELRVTFDSDDRDTDFLEHFIPWRWFFQQFPCVKVLRTQGADDSSIARILLQGSQEPGDDLACLPALEEIELSKSLLLTHERQSRITRARVAAIQPFVSARQHAGRPVKVLFT